MTTETLIIGKQEYTVEVRDLNQADLLFYPENPRVYSVLNMMGGDPTQEEIEDHMCGLDHVKQLNLPSWKETVDWQRIVFFAHTIL